MVQWYCSTLDALRKQVERDNIENRIGVRKQVIRRMAKRQTMDNKH